MHVRIGLNSSNALFSAVLLLAACATDSAPDDETGGAGTGGNATAGSAGAGRSGGSSGKGGTPGTSGAGAGTGGSTGGAGAAAGGSAGAAGTPGTGGGGMPAGGASGRGGGPAGSAGSSGTGGVAGLGGSTGPGGAGAGGTGQGGAAAGTGGATSGSGGAGTGGAAGSGGSGPTSSAGCGKTRTLMNGRKTIQSGGNREYILRVPDNYDNSHPYRLIIAYHWLNGNASQVAEGGGSTEDPYYGLWDLAENSTIFVAPEGLDAGWANSNGRDVALTDVILEQIENDLCIDTTRIFATGFSYGAGMSYAIACARADVFRGVALYAGSQLSGCSGGTTPIAYLHVHGVADSVLNISQGRSLRDHYVTVNGCTQQSPPEAARGSGTHTCTSYAGCSEGHPLRWCTHGGDHNPTEKDSGQNKSWVPGEAWEFISQF